MDLKELTDKELELLIYEYRNERYDPRFLKKLYEERKRRWTE